MTIRAVRQAIGCLLMVTVAALGGAAKRSQFPSSNHKTAYLSKASKMSEAGLHPADFCNTLPSLSICNDGSVGLPVISRDVFDQGSRFLTIFSRILRIELQSPPLLV